MAVNPVGLVPSIVVHAGDGPGVLVNRDISTQIIIGVDSSIVGNNPTSASILDPLVGLPVDGKEDIYAALIVAGPPVLVDFMKKAKNWNPSPAQAAAQINALGLMKDTTGQTINNTTGSLNPGIPNSIASTGVPLLSKSSSLFNHAAAAIAASGQIQLGPFTLNQIGYEIELTAQANAASTYPFGSVLMQWSDSVSGLIVAQEKWFFAGANPGTQIYFGTGQTKGDTLTIFITNLDTAHSMTIGMVGLINSRIYPRDDWRQQTNNAVPNFTNANYSQQANFLVQTAPNVNNGGITSRILPLYCGKARLWAFAVLPFDISISALNADISVAPGGNQIFEDKVTAAGGGIMSENLDLPRSICIINIANNGGAITQIGAAVIVSEQPQ